MPASSTPQPCFDCVNIHGDKPAEWLNKWPAGAEWNSRYQLHLCDGCAEERQSEEQAERDFWTDDCYFMPAY